MNTSNEFAKNKLVGSGELEIDLFGPSASMATLRRRAELLVRLRTFFHAQGYWEAETPFASCDACVDAHLDPFSIVYQPEGGTENQQQILYLQTSPEFGMKRLLAAGSGSIFQVSRAFRNGEAGTRHNPEFTLVEWYRVHGHYHQLMDEVGLLIQHLGYRHGVHRLSYREAFQRFAEFDPFFISLETLQTLAVQFGCASSLQDRDDLLNFVLAAVVEPGLASLGAVMLHDYPASQAALARVRSGPPDIAERFELYIDGVEICNGYQELTDPSELRVRNQRQNARRQEMGKRPLPVESRLLSAMEAGLPECSGVALGFDRLVMILTHSQSFADVWSFPLSRA